MSDTIAAPAVAGTGKQQPAKVLDYNKGAFVGELVRKHLERAGEKKNKRTGELYQQQKDSFELTLARTGAKCSFQVAEQAFNPLQEGDHVRIDYEIGGSRLDGLYFVRVIMVTRVQRGNGRASQGSAVQQFVDQG